MKRFVGMLVLAGCGVSEARVKELIGESDGGTTPTDGGGTVGGGVSQDDLDALRDELEGYTDDAVAGVSGGGGPVDASDITGTLDGSVLPDIPVGKLPLRTHRVSLPIYASFLQGGAVLVRGAFGNAGISMPAGAGEFSHSLIVPDDYDPAYPLEIHIVWRAVDASCTFNLRANFLDVARIGEVPASGNAIGGLVDAAPFTAPGTAQTASEIVVEVLDVNGDRLEPGDVANFGFYRSSDTCGTVSVAGLSVTYDAR